VSFLVFANLIRVRIDPLPLTVIS